MEIAQSASPFLVSDNTLDHEELNELRDHAAVAIHHVQELEELAWRGNVFSRRHEFGKAL